MKTIIAGPRTFTDFSVLEQAIKDSGFIITEVFCGKAQGVDTLGEQWALQNKILVKYFPANWEVLGKRAGPVRNTAMALEAEALLAIWDGKSKGTDNMITTATCFGLKTYVHRIP